MSEHTKVTPKDFFLWVGAMAALYFSVGSFIILSFEYIERLVGTTAVIGYDPYSDSIRFAIASLIVLFPVYVIITRMLQGDIRNNPEKKNIWVRKWLIFLTVFGSAHLLLPVLSCMISCTTERDNARGLVLGRELRVGISCHPPVGSFAHHRTIVL